MGIVIIVIIALLAVGGIYAYANYDPETFNGIINNIPGISTSENKLKDCSIYKEEYNRAVSDDMDNLITGALDGVAKTRACEKYNAEIKRQAEDKRIAVLRAEAEYVKMKAEEQRQIDIREQTMYAEDIPRQCKDLTQKDLRRCDLREYIALTDRDFSYVDLRGAYLYGLDFSRSNFTGANLNNANFGATITTDAIFTGCQGIPQNAPHIICTPNMGG